MEIKMEKLNEKIKTMINRRTLVSLYNEIKNNPLRTWIARDLGGGYIKTYLQTLLELGLIKRVETHYMAGAGLRVERSTDGYRYNSKYMSKRSINSFIINNEEVITNDAIEKENE